MVVNAGPYLRQMKGKLKSNKGDFKACQWEQQEKIILEVTEVPTDGLPVAVGA
jgi:hypothetical protein